jgi:hypothetical protein
MPATAYLRRSVLSALSNEDRCEWYGREVRCVATPVIRLDWLFSIASLTVKLAAFGERREFLEAVDIPRNNGLRR